jgi:hypothetical protein
MGCGSGPALEDRPRRRRRLERHPPTVRSRSLRAARPPGWLEASGIQNGPLGWPVNRHGQILNERLTHKGVARILKRACERAGLDPARYAGHCLRSGLARPASFKRMPPTGSRFEQQRAPGRAGSPLADLRGLPGLGHPADSRVHLTFRRLHRCGPGGTASRLSSEGTHAARDDTRQATALVSRSIGQ